ncbi:hypothetical protein CC1G_14350 [Coprinopsis cinerea okayama7|uniref:Uncharacterized protein n=1 Tax=Coprinopsis cinerea (strain Okayama-7 / 130 / ATCC MYA-4618 / FGSC 9003) TaxID=240176 RepID=D6RLZ9_COPC7|nr:hypothetical protein CC1G_14350 [Coprinopsis cinerea okayama7\|eukprot:XP_002911351.1 hypothetical protein CC1G_14350 [Coprinopsis cinerea okayama7\
MATFKLSSPRSLTFLVGERRQKGRRLWVRGSNHQYHVVFVFRNLRHCSVIRSQELKGFAGVDLQCRVSSFFRECRSPVIFAFGNEAGEVERTPFLQDMRHRCTEYNWQVLQPSIEYTFAPSTNGERVPEPAVQFLGDLSTGTIVLECGCQCERLDNQHQLNWAHRLQTGLKLKLPPVLRSTCTQCCHSIDTPLHSTFICQPVPAGANALENASPSPSGSSSNLEGRTHAVPCERCAYYDDGRLSVVHASKVRTKPFTPSINCITDLGGALFLSYVLVETKAKRKWKCCQRKFSSERPSLEKKKDSFLNYSGYWLSSVDLELDPGSTYSNGQFNLNQHDPSKVDRAPSELTH